MSSGTKLKSEFLVGKTLAERIVSVAKGRQVRCAVAFWSAIGVGEVFPSGVPKDAKIICDISMGSTSPEALFALRAPNNPNLRHSVRMHAKVFISDEGLVVGSANASASALGEADGPLCNTEAGTFHSPGSPSWKSAATWFDQLLNESPDVGDHEVGWAKLIYRPKPSVVQPRKLTSGSLFDIVTAAPWRFDKVGFVFTSTPSEEDEMAKVREQAVKSGIYDPVSIEELDKDWIFPNWSKKDFGRWPEYFLSFWQPKSRLSVNGCRVIARISESCSVMTSKDWSGLKVSCKVALPSLRKISEVDAQMALRIRGKSSDVLYANGRELASRIATIQAENN